LFIFDPGEQPSGCWRQPRGPPGSGSAPDGYTLYQPALSTFVSLRSPAPNIPVHVPQDFLPIGFVAENPMFIAVAPSLSISTLPEQIARAKKAPGEIAYAPPGSDA
jgi:tripartite-type tricarboxylate transporter receptor subunit TctC